MAKTTTKDTTKQSKEKKEAKQENATDNKILEQAVPSKDETIGRETNDVGTDIPELSENETIGNTSDGLAGSNNSDKTTSDNGNTDSDSDGSESDKSEVEVEPKETTEAKVTKKQKITNEKTPTVFDVIRWRRLGRR